MSRASARLLGHWAIGRLGNRNFPKDLKTQEPSCLIFSLGILIDRITQSIPSGFENTIAVTSVDIFSI